MVKTKEELKEYVIFMYSTVHLLKKDKIRFYYALKGRDGKTGIVKRKTIQQLGRTVLMAEAKNKSEIEAFLNYWKCKFEMMHIWKEE